MMRIVIFLSAVVVASLGAAWLADRPGAVTVMWLGSRIETSVMVLVAGLFALAALLAALWLALRWTVYLPARMRQAREARRMRRGHAAIAHGLIAVGAGDLASARKLAQRARHFTPHEPLTLLLQSQAAQLGQDAAAADAAFRAMAERGDMRGLGLHGLHVEAMRRGDTVAADAYAEQAVAAGAIADWSYQAVLASRCAAKDWAGALVLIERTLVAKAIDKDTRNRHRAVVLTAQARDGALDRDAETAALLEAVQLAPTLVPTAAMAGRRMAEAGNRRRAARILETAWRASPHPDLAEAYAQVNLGASARDRLARLSALLQRAPGGEDGALALARAAFAAQDFDGARKALEPLLAEPTRAAATLMAQIAVADTGDEGLARSWLARALRARPDRAWIADGVICSEWQAFSPASGRVDACRWELPKEAPAAAAAEIVFTPPAGLLPARPAAGPQPAVFSALPETGNRPLGAPPPVIASAPIPDDPGPDGDDIISRHP